MKKAQDLYEVNNRKAVWEQVTKSIENKLKNFILRTLRNHVRLW